MVGITETKILYLCNGEKCKICHSPTCRHTADENFAKNPYGQREFEKIYGTLVEVEGKKGE